MPGTAKLWLTLAGLIGAAAVIMGALGSHALSVADAQRFRLANHYHLAHALALLALAALGTARGFSISLNFALVCMAVGTVVFCGSLYALALGAPAALARAAPIGGGLLILGWLALALAPWLGDR